MKKVGVVITTHGNFGRMAEACIKSFISNLPENSYIVVFINESKEKYTLDLPKKFKNIDFVYISNQKINGGLTGTWNQGIDLCFKKDCEIIVLSNNDLVINNTFQNILEEANEAEEKKELKYFGPISNNPGYPTQKATIKNFNTKTKIVDNGNHALNGFLMVFPKNSLIKNKLNKKYYFNQIKHPFGGNEDEWWARFRGKSGTANIVYKTVVKHHKNKTWRRSQIKPMVSNKIILKKIDRWSRKLQLQRLRKI